jgi:hypothetical protein
MTQITERIAGGVLVSLVGGFLIVVTLGISVYRAFIVWLLTVICSGLVIGRTETSSIGPLLKGGAFPALVLSAIPVLFLYLLTVITFVEAPARIPEVEWGGRPINPLNPAVIIGEVILWVACFLGSLMFIVISMIASPVLLEGAQKLYRFGPKGVNRVKLIIVGVGGVLAAALSLLSVLGK